MKNQFNHKKFIHKKTYNGALGALYSPNFTIFKVWSPHAESLSLNLYQTGHGDTFIDKYTMKKNKNGIFEYTIKGDLHGKYYTYTVCHQGIFTETSDPYAKAAGVNGNRSMVIDLTKTHPDQWENDCGPKLNSPVDAVIYEVHIRDLTIHKSSQATHMGKFLGLAETARSSSMDIKTGIEHFKELGVTHIQLLPFFDFSSVDESQPEKSQYNWGYDPKNYNLPEGSYSTDPFSGEVRIKELKTMIQALHNKGLGVIMDVVYNHTAESETSNFHSLVPFYYHRFKGKQFSNASACGNETASERPMMRHFMIESLKYWASEYHIDGFRFDLMGIHDIGTMRRIEKELRLINPDILLYGEGWAGGDSPLPERNRLLKKNISIAPGIGVFNDDLRDGIKGHVFESEKKGFANGGFGFEESVKFGIVGGIKHPQIDYRKLQYSKKPWAISPTQSINYVEAHDNLTLWDKLSYSNPEATLEERLQIFRLCSAIVLTSQGIPFLHLGMDFLRSKQGEENSYKSPDAINQIDWNRKVDYYKVFQYHQGLIQLRKTYPEFRLRDSKKVCRHLSFINSLPHQLIGYTIRSLCGAYKLWIYFNGGKSEHTLNFSPTTYHLLATIDDIYLDEMAPFNGGDLKLPAHGLLILKEYL